MKRILFLFIGIIGFISLAVAAEEGAPYIGSRETETSLRAPAKGSSPQWKSSLTEIEKTTAALLDANRQLTIEYSDLSNQIIAIEADITDQRKKNTAYVGALPERQKAADGTEDQSRLKTKIFKAEQDLAQKKKDFAALKVKAQGMESRLVLRRLKAKAVELERKSLFVDHKAYEDTVIGELKQSVGGLKEKIASQKGQEELLREKLIKLSRVDKPYVAEAKKVTQDNSALKDRLADLNRENKNVLAQMEAIGQKKSAMENNKMLQRYMQMTGQQKALEVKIAETSARKEELGKALSLGKVQMEETSKDTLALNTQNKDMQEEIDNLRENIAVLEYKIKSIERYKDRNRKQGR